MGDAYQMSIDRLSELQDLIDKFNAAKPADKKAAMEEIVNFLADDYRQITLAAHKRMDIIVGALLMLGEVQPVYNKTLQSLPVRPIINCWRLPFRSILSSRKVEMWLWTERICLSLI